MNQICQWSESGRLPPKKYCPNHKMKIFGNLRSPSTPSITSRCLLNHKPFFTRVPKKLSSGCKNNYHWVLLHLLAPKTFRRMHCNLAGGFTGKLFKCCTNNASGIRSYKQKAFALLMKWLWERWPESSWFCNKLNVCLTGNANGELGAEITNQTLKLSFSHNWNLYISLWKNFNVMVISLR